MKKIICFLCALLFPVIMFSCANSEGNKTGESTKKSDATSTPETKDPLKPTVVPKEISRYFKTVTFERTAPFRTTVIEAMRKMAAIEWVNQHSFSASGGTANSNQIYKAKRTYYGLPYANKPTTLEEFADIIKKGTFEPSGETDWNKVAGLQCVTAVNYALQSCINIDANASEYYIPGYNHQDGKDGTNGTPNHVFMSDHFLLLGDYTVPSYTDKSGNTVITCTKNGLEKMSQCYALLKQGDVIFKADPKTGFRHVRLISGETVVNYTADGKIDPKTSKITTVEQTNQFDGNKNTTWWLDHEYTFETLYNTSFVPLTLKEYEHESDYAEPYLALEREITPKALANNYVNANVCSNFPIRYIKCELCDTEGNVIVDAFTINRTTLNLHTLTVNNATSDILKKAEAGKTYTYKLYGCLAAGEKLIYEVEFTK